MSTVDTPPGTSACREFSPAPRLPSIFLNAYEILNARDLGWGVNIYSVDLAGEPNRHEQRSQIKNVIWELRKKSKEKCPGFGFVVDISPRLVAVPQTWQLPSPLSDQHFSLNLERTFVASARCTDDRSIISGILRDALKAHFKKRASESLGNLWQDYNSFCQYPSQPRGDYLRCRRFAFSPKVLRDGRWAVRFSISTLTLDGKTFNEYYEQGSVDQLAERLEARRGERFNRDNRPIAVRVLHQPSSGILPLKCLDFEDFDLVLRHGALSRSTQRSLASTNLKCRSFAGPAIELPLDELRLILGSEITQEEHSETIIEPRERERLTSHVRDFVHNADIFGQPLQLSEVPVDVESLETKFVLPPALRMKSATGEVEILPAPQIASEAELRGRAQKRLNNIKRNGFLIQRPINPLLAWPAKEGPASGHRMKRDLEFYCDDQNLPITFGLIVYHDVEEIARAIEANAYDSVLAVVPEPSWHRFGADSTHEKIKKRLEVPSQCLAYDHTLPKKWVNKPARDFRTADPRIAKRVRQTYELCVLNLLVKSHWFPFAPASPFHYNVQVGLDVGGIHNTRAMACLGYGFRDPSGPLFLRPEEIPIEFQKKEPIPTQCLFSGLSSLFDLAMSELGSNDVTPDFETVVFYRDGQLLGDGDKWNECDALQRLHDHYLKRGLISSHSVWTAVEVMKGAEGWRILRNEGGIRNPLVGQCVFPFDDDKTALICTSGAPYLTQGTASLLLAHIIDIYGQSDRHKVAQDLIWQSDLCFTKPDMGMSLPWVLNVADTGALQLSRSYRMTGITA